MRYWKFKESNRVIKADVLMNPDRWEEITKEQYNAIKDTQSNGTKVL